MKHRLKGVTGSFEGEVKATSGDYIRHALICYTGIFRTMDMDEDDDDLVVTKEMLERVAQNYNAKITKAKAKENGALKDKYLAPLQLDHEESASVTVGRVIGNLCVKPYTLLDGTEVYGLFGDVKVSGSDNIEKCEDGRWSSLSIGCDFTMGILTELTITPFPAAAEASLLSKPKKNMGAKSMNTKAKCLKYMMDKKGMSKDEAEQKFEKMSEEAQEKMSQDYQKMMDEDKKDDEKKMSNAEDLPESKMSKGEDSDEDKMAKSIAMKAMSYMKKMMDDETTSDSDKKDEKKMSADKDEDESKMSNAEDLPESKMSDEKKDDESKMSNAEDLPESKMSSGESEEDSKMSSEDKDDSKMSDEKKDDESKMAKGEDEDEDEKKMSKESAPEDKKGEEPSPAEIKKVNSDMGKKKMSLSKDQKAKFSKLKAAFKKSDDTAKMSIKKARVVSRLSALKASAKITPAEIAKIDMDNLCGQTDEAINAVMSSYDSREPVIHTGLLGTQKALDLSQLSAEIKKVNLKKQEDESVSNMPFLQKARMAGGKAKSTTESMTPVSAISPEELEKVSENVAKLSKEGNIEGVVGLVNKTLEDVKKLSMGSRKDVKMGSERINDIEKSISEMRQSYNDIVNLLNEVFDQE